MYNIICMYVRMVKLYLAATSFNKTNNSLTSDILRPLWIQFPLWSDTCPSQNLIRSSFGKCQKNFSCTYMCQNTSQSLFHALLCMCMYGCMYVVLCYEVTSCVAIKESSHCFLGRRNVFSGLTDSRTGAQLQITHYSPTVMLKTYGSRDYSTAASVVATRNALMWKSYMF